MRSTLHTWLLSAITWHNAKASKRQSRLRCRALDSHAQPQPEVTPYIDAVGIHALHHRLGKLQPGRELAIPKVHPFRVPGTCVAMAPVHEHAIDVLPWR